MLICCRADFINWNGFGYFKADDQIKVQVRLSSVFYITLIYH